MRLVSQRDIPVGLFLLSPIPVRIPVKFRDALAKQLSRAVVIRNFRLASRLVISEGCLRVIPRRIANHVEHSVMSIRGLVGMGLCWCPIFVLDDRSVWLYLTFVERAVHESSTSVTGLPLVSRRMSQS